MNDVYPEQQEPSPAQPPFDDPNADVILRSSDGVDFYTFKIILSLASPVFKTMFSLRLPRDAESISPSSPHVVTVTESSETLEHLLLYCFPRSSSSTPSFDSLDDGVAVAEAAAKYDMQGVLGHVKERLVASPFLETDPITFYGVSCRKGWKAEAQLAAARAVEVVEFGCMDHYVPELENITAGAYYRLLRYRLDCCVASKKLLENLTWLPKASGLEALLDPHHRSCVSGGGIKATGSRGQTTAIPPLWFCEYLKGTGEELFVQPRAYTVMDSDLYHAALLKASQGCQTCRSRGAQALTRFRNLCAAEVSKVAFKVKLEFKS
ncbi:hypothetical protein BV22DRAFT_1131289 [Leucogyrophana mollusca]|uniref:Uncharacterized protein n=1 Tax=Leucogyrophana mollusca TaxID=85980 RepID=A0ACB8BAK7_9AGAM|nr:hypothetical protein BV22DRAFT_1131289 [Leucogyrophana mollusca]